MNPTWPMVFGALAAGIIFGAIVPQKEPAVLNLPEQRAAPQQASMKNAEPGPESPASAPEPARTTATPAEAQQTERAANDCRRQAWPYYDSACLDRAAPAPAPVRVVATEPADPADTLQPAAPSQREAKSEEQTAKGEAEVKETRPADEAGAKSAAKPRSERQRARQSTRTEREEINRSDEAEEEDEAAQPTRTRRQPRVAQDDDQVPRERPRILILRDGTRIYIPPRSHYVRRLNGGL